MKKGRGRGGGSLKIRKGGQWRREREGYWLCVCGRVCVCVYWVEGGINFPCHVQHLSPPHSVCQVCFRGNEPTIVSRLGKGFNLRFKPSSIICTLSVTHTHTTRQLSIRHSPLTSAWPLFVSSYLNVSHVTSHWQHCNSRIRRGACFFNAGALCFLWDQKTHPVLLIMKSLIQNQSVWMKSIS